jgi:hypothetical protein
MVVMGFMRERERELGGDGRGGRAAASPPPTEVACPGREERRSGFGELSRPWTRGVGAHTTGELCRHAHSRPPSSRLQPQGAAVHPETACCPPAAWSGDNDAHGIRRQDLLCGVSVEMNEQ